MENTILNITDDNTVYRASVSPSNDQYNNFNSGILHNIVIPQNKFYKVSFEEFCKEASKCLDIKDEEKLRTIYENIKLPRRSTKYSAGYDFYCPFDLHIPAQESITIPTGIKCEMVPEFFLGLLPRSSYGFKYNMTLDNTMGVIDKDYFNNESNEGHIMVKITCGLKKKSLLDKLLFFTKKRKNKIYSMDIVNGDKFCQGIFFLYGKVIYDNPISEERTGGMGSTGN